MAFISSKLAKAGYFGGDPSNVLNAPVEVVEALLDYENFEGDYQKEYLALNKE